MSTGTTGHAESVQVTYDPAQISFGQLLKIYFSVHDPTELNRQDPDEGTQYRSEIFYTTPEQKSIAEAYIRQLGATKVFGRPIVTKVAPLQAFYRAEDYHQDYVLHCTQIRPCAEQGICLPLRHTKGGELPSPVPRIRERRQSVTVYRFSKPQRRSFVKLLGAGLSAAFVRRWSSAATSAKNRVRIVEFDASGIRTGVVEVEKVEKPLAE
jgi:methionine-S-sulfoxide reductase